VVLGATNLYLVSRKYGTQLVRSQFAEYVHLSPERLEKAEGWFKRYGVLAIIFGRHIPGFRVPITVASGVFRIPYRVFAPCVAVSSAIWAGVMLTLGVTLGPRLAVLLRAHGEVYFIWAGLVVVIVVGMYWRQRRVNAEAGRRRLADRQVESPSS
jgi:membrane protein DedA with SNARE-associated domain